MGQGVNYPCKLREVGNWPCFVLCVFDLKLFCFAVFFKIALCSGFRAIMPWNLNDALVQIRNAGTDSDTSRMDVFFNLIYSLCSIHRTFSSAARRRQQRTSRRTTSSASCSALLRRSESEPLLSRTWSGSRCTGPEGAWRATRVS